MISEDTKEDGMGTELRGAIAGERESSIGSVFGLRSGKVECEL
jgi:hypothetical protein